MSLWHIIAKDKPDVTCRVYQDFVDKVAEGRGMSSEDVHKVARGRVWTGEDAPRVGLVDQLGGLADAIQLAKQEAGLPQVSSNA